MKRLFRWNRSINDGWEYVKDMDEHERYDTESTEYNYTVIPHDVEPSSLFNIWIKHQNTWRICGWTTDDYGGESRMLTLSQNKLPE